jgi:hypothetical protein
MRNTADVTGGKPIAVCIDTYHSRFIPEGVAEASQIFLLDAHVLTKLLRYEEYCRRDRWQAHRRLN